MWRSCEAPRLSWGFALVLLERPGKHDIESVLLSGSSGGTMYTPERIPLSMAEFTTITIAGARVAGWLILIVTLLLSGPLLMLALGRVPLHGDWRTATHRSAGLAPDPATHREAVVQVYVSRAFGWRGAFAVHSWLAAKRPNADRYTRYEVIGWYARGGGSSVSISDSSAPDAEWYGAAPSLILDLRGADAETVLSKLPQAAADYPHTASYRVWPGPNSNTFIAHLGP